MLSKKSYLPLISYLLVVCYIPGFLFFSVPFSEYKGYSFVEPPAVVIVVAVLALLIINFIWRIKETRRR
jgi:Na+/proline symporter